MNNLSELLKNIPRNGLMRELLYIVAGLFLLIILNYLYSPSSASYPNWIYLPDYAKVVVVIVVAYFLARACNKIGELITRFSIYLLGNNKIDNSKIYFRKVRRFLNGEIPAWIYDECDLNGAEINEFILTREGISFLHERNAQYAILSSTLLGFTFLLGVFYSAYLFIALMIILMFDIDHRYKMWRSRIEIIRFLRKEKEKKK